MLLPRGICAEEMILGSCSYDCNRIATEKAIRLAQTITFEGVDVGKWPKHAKRDRFDAAMSIIEQCKKQVREALSTRLEEIITVAGELKRKRTLTGDDVADIIAHVEKRQRGKK